MANNYRHYYFIVSENNLICKKIAYLSKLIIWVLPTHNFIAVETTPFLTPNITALHTDFLQQFTLVTSNRHKCSTFIPFKYRTCQQMNLLNSFIVVIIVVVIIISLELTSIDSTVQWCYHPYIFLPFWGDIWKVWPMAVMKIA